MISIINIRAETYDFCRALQLSIYVVDVFVLVNIDIFCGHLDK